MTAPTAIPYGNTSEITKVPSPTTFLFFIVVYKFEEHVSEAFGHFCTKKRLKPPEKPP
jgi:hypothetical protein